MSSSEVTIIISAFLGSINIKTTIFSTSIER